MATVEQGVGGGISFGLSDEQKALRELAREFAEKEIRPKEAEYDEHETHPADVIAKAHEVGLMNLHIPEAFGGPGLGCFDGLLVGEELAWGCSGIATSITANGLGAGPVVAFGTDEQKRQWLSPLLEEPLLCSFGLTEPNAGSDVAGIQTTAVRKGDEYVINGSKMFITNAGHAAWFVVFASTDKSKGHKGMTASSSRPTPRASSSGSTRTRWASARPTPRRSRSRTSSSPPRTASARRARASRSR